MMNRFLKVQLDIIRSPLSTMFGFEVLPWEKAVG